MKPLILIAVLHTALSCAAFDLQGAIDEAKSGATVVVPAGTYTTPIAVRRGITLKGEAGAVLQVEANTPAILVDAYKDVVIDGLTVRWKLEREAAEGDLPYALLVRGGEAVIRNCMFEALGGSDRAPAAVMAQDRAAMEITNCCFNGFEFTIQFWNGAAGGVEECVILDPGHCGITIGQDSRAAIRNNIVTGSGYHGIRCTGGEIMAEGNLLIRNRNRGFYIGNRSANGMLKNNLVVENGVGVSVFGRSKLEIAHNVILRSSHAGLSLIDIAQLKIENNIIAENGQGIAGFAADEKTEPSVRVKGRNLLHGNSTESERAVLSSGTLRNAPEFSDPDDGLFRSPAKDMGLEHPEEMQQLWKRWQAALDRP